mgnify:CR=1 FL=1
MDKDIGFEESVRRATFKKIKVQLMLRTLFCCFLLTLCFEISAQQPNFSYLDIFDLQYVTDPQISPDGEWIVYRRMGFDIMKDRAAGNLWLLRKDGSNHQK